MSAKTDLELIRENYQRLPDDELTRIATKDAAGPHRGSEGNSKIRN